jgi:hypothetical protein
MRLPLASAMAVTALLALPAVAAPGQPGRYEMSRVSDGILRLDTATGAVSVCRREEEEWTCKPIGDPQLDLQREVERLRKENDALRSALESAAEVPAPPLPPEATDKKQDRLVPEAKPEMPGEETIDQMMAVLEKMMRRFRDMVESYEHRKDAPEPPEQERKL